MEITTEKKRTLIFNFSWSFIGNSIYAACQFCILIILAKFGSVDIVGTFALASAVTAPFFMFTNLNLRGVLASDIHDNYPFSYYFYARLFCSTISVVCLLIFVIILNYNIKVSMVIILITLSKCLESLSDIIFGLFQKKERMDHIGKSMILRGVVLLSAMCLTMVLTKELLLSILGYTLVFLFFYLIVDYKQLKEYTLIRRDYDLYKIILSLVKLSIPLGFVLMLVSLNINIPRYFIEHSLGRGELGYFAAISNILVAGNTIVTALGQSVTPRLSKSFYEGKISDIYIIAKLMGCIALVLGSFFVLTSILFGEQFLIILYRTEYSNYVDTFILISVNSFLVFSCSFLGYILTAARQFKVQPFILLIATLTNVIICYFFVPIYGINGAVAGMSVSSLVQMILSVYLVMREISTRRSKVIGGN